MGMYAVDGKNQRVLVLHTYLKCFIGQYTLKGCCLNRELFDTLAYWSYVETGLPLLPQKCVFSETQAIAIPLKHKHLLEQTSDTTDGLSSFSIGAAWDSSSSTRTTNSSSSTIPTTCDSGIDETQNLTQTIQSRIRQSYVFQLSWPHTHLHWDNALPCIPQRFIVYSTDRNRLPPGSFIWPLIKHSYEGHFVVPNCKNSIPSSFFPTLSMSSVRSRSLTLVDDPNSSVCTKIPAEYFQWLSHIENLRIIPTREHLGDGLYQSENVDEERERESLQRWWKTVFGFLNQLTSLDTGCYCDPCMTHGFQHLRNLRCLKLWESPNTLGCSNDSEVVDFSSFYFFRNLTRLDIQSSWYTDQALQQLAHAAPNLSVLNMSRVNVLNAPLIWTGELLTNISSPIRYSPLSFDPYHNLMTSIRHLWIPNQTNIDDNTFQHLSTVETLCIDRCSQTEITNGAFYHLQQLKSLSMRDCYQTTISTDAFRHLGKLTYLNMEMPWLRREDPPTYDLDTLLTWTPQLRHWRVSLSAYFGATSDVFSLCSQLTTLEIESDRLSTITDQSFSSLQCLQCFAINVNEKITPRAMDYLSSLRSFEALRVGQNGPSCMDDKALSYLSNLETVSIVGLHHITDSGLCHLSRVRSLDMRGCYQDTITDNGFKNMKELRELNMYNCTQTTLSDQMFAHLSKLTRLQMEHCDQTTITDNAFTHLPKLQVLECCFCSQLTVNAKVHLHQLEVFNGHVEIKGLNEGRTANKKNVII